MNKKGRDNLFHVRTQQKQNGNRQQRRIRHCRVASFSFALKGLWKLASHIVAGSRIANDCVLKRRRKTFGHFHCPLRDGFITPPNQPLRSWLISQVAPRLCAFALNQIDLGLVELVPPNPFSLRVFRGARSFVAGGAVAASLVARVFLAATVLVGVRHPLRLAGFGAEFPHWLDGFRTRLRHDHERAAFVAERGAHFAAEIFFVGVGK